MPSPLRDHAPRWVEVPPPEPVARDRRRMRSIPAVLSVGVVIAAWGCVLAAAWGLMFWPAVGGGVLTIPVAWSMLVAARYSASRRLHEQWRAGEWARFQRALADWNARVAEHDRHEQERVSSTLLWHPLHPEPGSRRVNVFGGTADGWASLLATLGLSILSEDSGLLVLDFTERSVAADLAMLARTVGFAVALDHLPGDGIGGLDDLSAAESGELLAEALISARGAQADAARARAVDAELIAAVIAELTPPHTFDRIAAGLAVVLRTLDVEAQTLLSADEVRRLNPLRDMVGASAFAVEELRFAAAALRLLAHPRHDATPPPGSWWPRGGLRVLATTDANARRKDLLDRWVFFRVLHAIRSAATGVGAVALAGADRFGMAELEALAHHAARLGVRLILLFEHLRGEQAQLLGGAASAGLLMQLGPAAEAGAAADFVGRGYRFVLSQLTEQVGRGFTDGTSDTTGDSVTATSTDNYSPSSAGRSDSRSRAVTWSQTSSWSRSSSTSTSHTWARAYEYAVEPTTFQSLPPTAFILVETTPRGRRVVAGDCNPGIALLDRVATRPRGDSEVVTC
ncbi:hypothetical protein [Nocardia terpenica]|uniref:Uncharacterized protein n=1 Tax=Nocardia terpenica TaxID=455432 RepID=A0A291RGG4_9NOCA|nr:hypothetical protein [Nocardia terpenica]ATL66686.1 hypothetical protein CRH09_11170 [Nocardia terpenica]